MVWTEMKMKMHSSNFRILEKNACNVKIGNSANAPGKTWQIVEKLSIKLHFEPFFVIFLSKPISYKPYRGEVFAPYRDC